MPAPAADSDPLRLTRCMRCGYALDGLGDVGICPECGLDYDQSMVVLYGEARGNTATAATGSIAAILLEVFGVTAYLLMGWMDFRSGRGILAFSNAAIFGVPLILMLIWRFSASRNVPGGGLTQCRFNAYGCLQCDAPEETVGVTYPRQLALWVFMLVFTLLCCVERQWIMLSIIGAFFLSLLIYFRRRWSAADAIARLNTDARRLMISARDDWRKAIAIPWTEVARISIAPAFARHDRHRVIVHRLTRWRGAPINAEVRCTVEQAAALRSRCEKWQGDVQDHTTAEKE